MIAANVAAAEALEQARPALHVPRPRPARPGEARGAAEFLDSLGIELARGQVIPRPSDFTRLLEQAAGTPDARR